jgi:hypothetical protein
VSVSSSASNPSFLSNDVVITNNSGQTATQLVYTLKLVAPTVVGEFFAEHVLPSSGLIDGQEVPLACTYSPASQVVTCLPPNLPTGTTAKFSIPLKSPTKVGPIALTSTLSFKESGNPDPGRVSSVPPVTDSIAITDTGPTATSAVPAATAVQLLIKKNGQQGNANVPEQHSFATTASIEFTPTSTLRFVCPKKEVCRDGDWVTATIPGTFDDQPLQFTLFWPAASVPKKQTVANFVMFYLPEDNSPVQVVKQCTVALPPCVTNIVHLSNGWQATLVNTHNGHMR